MAPQENSIGNADPSSMADPAHHSSADESHTMTDGEKPTKLVDVIMDPDFLPTTAKAPLLRKIQAYGVLLVLVMGGMVGARTVLGIEILQTPMHTFVATGVVVAGAILAITGDIDWWDLVLGYWWFSLPAAGLAGLALVVMGENATPMHHVE